MFAFGCVPHDVSSRAFQGADGFYISIPKAAHKVLAFGYLLLLFQSKESKSRNKS